MSRTSQTDKNRIILVARGPISMRCLGVMCLLITASGCATPWLHKMSGSGGNLTLSSQVDTELERKASFENGLYTLEEGKRLTMVLFDGPAENPTRALTVRMFWRPRAARTPIDPTATNASVYYIVFRDGPVPAQVGVYSGGGFVYPYSEPGASAIKVGIWDATLRLQDASKDFEDNLTPATIKGRVVVHRDETGIHRQLRQLQVLIRDRLGYPKFVRTD